MLNARGQRDVVTARVIDQCRRRLEPNFYRDRIAHGAATSAHSRQRQSHRGAPALRSRPRLHLASRRRRVVFAIPFERDFTLIGTTDTPFAGDPSVVLPSGEEIDYLCGVANEYFRAEIGAADVVWAYSGVRSLYDDGARKAQDIGRDYALLLDERFGEAPMLTVYGGKITTYRRLAEDALARLSHFFTRSRPWTASRPLPGGDFVYDGVDTLVERTQRNWGF